MVFRDGRRNGSEKSGQGTRVAHARQIYAHGSTESDDTIDRNGRHDRQKSGFGLVWLRADATHGALPEVPQIHHLRLSESVDRCVKRGLGQFFLRGKKFVRRHIPLLEFVDSCSAFGKPSAGENA